MNAKVGPSGDLIKWALPKRVKIFEALSAVVDGRVEVTGPTTAKVTSSSKDKAYDIAWSPDRTRITSNDNASYYQGYLGYPVLAVLMTLSMLPFPAKEASMLGGIPWKAINTKHKNNYDKALQEVFASLRQEGFNTDPLDREVDAIFAAMQHLELFKLPVRRRPPSHL